MSRLELHNSVSIHYRDDNTHDRDARHTLLFFNGATLPLAFWDPVVDELRGMYRCIRFDQRNAGDTVYTGTFTLNDIARDAASVLHALDVTEVIVVGHAWGGRAAQVFARDYPHLVTAMIICGTGGQLPATTNTAVLRTMTQAARAQDRQTWEDALHQTFCAADFRGRAPNEFAAICDLLWTKKPCSSAKWDSNVAPSASYWGSAQVPALLIYGREDKNGTPENARNLQATLPQARLEFIEDAGHFVVRERAAAVCASMHEFMQELSI